MVLKVIENTQQRMEDLSNDDGNKAEKKRERRSKKLNTEKKKKARKKEEDLQEEADLNNSAVKRENVSRSDTENEDRIKNDISEIPSTSKEKNTNVVKEKKRKKAGTDGHKEKGKSEKKSRDKNKKVDFDPNLSKQESNEVIGVFLHECEVLGN